jgi:hypothetical protein
MRHTSAALAGTRLAGVESRLRWLNEMGGFLQPIFFVVGDFLQEPSSFQRWMQQ